MLQFFNFWTDIHGFFVDTHAWIAGSALGPAPTPSTSFQHISLAKMLVLIQIPKDPYLFIKGASLNQIAKQLLGDGIFTSDGGSSIFGSVNLNPKIPVN